MESLWGLEKWSIGKVLESVVEELSDGGLKGKDSEDRLKFIDEFLQSPKNKPELQKVLTMWQVSSESLAGKGNLENSAKYRESLRNYAEGILKEKGRDEAEVRKYWETLSDGFKQSVEGSAQNIDSRAKTTFFNAISFKVVARLPNERFMEG